MAFSSLWRSEPLSFSASSSCWLASDATAVPSRYNPVSRVDARRAVITDHGIFNEFNRLIDHPFAQLPTYPGHRLILEQRNPRWCVAY
jgi:hypothetical protein